MTRRLIASLLLITLTACSKENVLPDLPDLKEVKANLAFSCVHEATHLPPLNPEADKLFQYARYQQTKPGERDYEEIGRYYRLAAAYGHYKANRNLQLLLSYGKVSSPSRMHEAIKLATQLVEQNIGMGYYDIGGYLKSGYGFKQDKDMALRYIRKAADLGNPEAQYYVAELLAPYDMAPEIARQMRRCAAEQGHGRAAFKLGIHLQEKKRYQEAVEAYQLGVAAGEGTSARMLGKAFDAPPQSEELHYLALSHDPERVRRYELIEKFIDDNEYRNGKVPDIDKIVPLPPAKLPAWDGSFQWAREHAVPPEQPSEELIQRMARDKGLDPATGLPLPPPPKAALGTRVATGEPCPEDGEYYASLVPGHRTFDHCRFTKGQIMPRRMFEDERIFAWMDKLMGTRYIMRPVQWVLARYSETDDQPSV